MNDDIYLDIGNTNAKWKFKGENFKVPTGKFDLDKLPKSSKIWISNVSRNFVFESKSNNVLVESQRCYKSLKNSYEEPSMLGSDRWLAMIALYEMNPNKGFIVIDIGTAVTIDYVDVSGMHKGGVIFPGLLKIRNTFEYFSVSKKKNINEISQSSKDAWSVGTLELLVSGINQKIRNMKVSELDVNIYLTGGGVREVEEYLNFSYILYKNLVLDGLELFANNMG